MSKIGNEVSVITIPNSGYLKSLMKKAKAAARGLVESIVEPRVIMSGRLAGTCYLPIRERREKMERRGPGTCFLCGEPINRNELCVPYVGYYAHLRCFDKKHGIKRDAEYYAHF